MTNTFRKIYKKTGNSGSSSDYQLVGNVGVDGVELDIMKGASSSTDGEIGLIPRPIKGQDKYLLQGNGTWKHPYTALNEIGLIGPVLFFPDYENRFAIISKEGGTYEIEYYGYIQLHGRNGSGTSGNSLMRCYINDVQIVEFTGPPNPYRYYQSGLFPVSPGDQISLQGGTWSESNNVYFIPLKSYNV